VCATDFLLPVGIKLYAPTSCAAPIEADASISLAVRRNYDTKKLLKHGWVQVYDKPYSHVTTGDEVAAWGQDHNPIKNKYICIMMIQG